MLTWTRATGHTETPVYIGRLVGGEVRTERERQARLRTYYVRRGEGTNPDDRRDRWYVKYRDHSGGPNWENTKSCPVCFFTKQAAQDWCARHLADVVPKIRVEFVGRRGSDFGDTLVWRESGRGMMQLQFAMLADEFYGQMVG